jgi:hypothetical protein
VLAIQGDDLVVDLGAARGASDHDTLQIWRPIKIKHPVTGRILADRFLLGSLEVTQVRPAMALARATAPLARPPEPGDIVVLALAASPAAPAAGPPSAGPQAPKPPDAEERPPEDPDARAVTELLDGLRGSDLWTRIQRYEALAQARPASRYARTLLEEAAALRELATARQKAPAAALAQAGARVLHFAPPKEALARSAIRVALELADASGAVLQYRAKGAQGYASLPMTPVGSGYFAATIRGEDVTGTVVEYFIEATGVNGRTIVVEGEPAAPREIPIFSPPPPSAPRKLAARVEITTDYADYDRMRGDDHAFQTEGFFRVRLGDVGVRALRAGFGVYRGVGGPLSQLEQPTPVTQSVGLTYGWLEAEFGFVRAFSMGARVDVGLLNEGVSGGGMLSFRIGSDLATNFLMSGEILGGVGLRGAAQLELASFPCVPIMVRAEVTNQPARTVGLGSGDVGLRGIVQVGYRFTPELTVAVRGSFEGRTIDHFGPGFGGAVGYSW